MRWFIFFSIAVLGAIGDLITKKLTSAITIEDIIPGILQFKPVLNKGIIWGLFQQGSVLFLVIPALAVPLIIVMFKYIHLFSGEPSRDRAAAAPSPPRLHLLLTAAFGLILAGALGNLYDRIAYKAVRDFIDFYIINWPIFNLADTYITIGAGLIVLSLFIPKRQSATVITGLPDCTEEPCCPNGAHQAGLPAPMDAETQPGPAVQPAGNDVEKSI